MNTELRIMNKEKRKKIFSLFPHTSYVPRPTASAGLGILHTSPRRGFTVLFAVLVGSLLFSLGLAIAELSIKEIVLSAAGKQSETAFFGADTGIECALYFDRRVANTFPDSSDTIPSGNKKITCNSKNSNNIPLSFSGNPTAATTTFQIPLSLGCANVTVGKTKSPGPGIPGNTIIESRGQNECGVGANPSRVERALRARY